MTETLTIRLPKTLARDLKAKAKSAKTNPSEVLRRAAEAYVREGHEARDARLEHVRKYAGSWNGYLSAADLIRKTRP
jgi:metal-responsive CopG/Arc/MetJ family transcriptional regulator